MERNLNILFLSVIDINNINDRGIYQDLLRKFRDEGHNVFIISPTERRNKAETALYVRDGVSLLKVRTLNIQKTNVIEKGLSVLLLQSQFSRAYKKHFSSIKFDLILYSTPPITLTDLILSIKHKDSATTYLLLKDIFPQNAVDLGMMKENGFLHQYFLKKEKRLYKVSDHIGCMSPANVQFVLEKNDELPKERLEVNPNSISPITAYLSQNEKKGIKIKYRISTEAIVFVYGGNLGKPQGIDFLLEVLKANQDREDVFFVIAGSGTEYQKVNTWMAKNNPANVLLISSLPKAEYDELIKACDIGLIFLDRKFTIPNFPSRLLSYLENKMPIIAATDPNTDIGSIVEAAGCGYWVISGDLEGYNKLINHFVNDPALIDEMGEKAYHLLMKEYVVDVSYNAIIDKLTLNGPINK